MNYQSLGSAISLAQKKQKFSTIDNLGVHFFIEFYKPAIVRVCAYRSPYHNHSYAVCQTPQEIALEVEQTSDLIHFKTSKLMVRLSKNPLRIAFFDLQENEINSDEMSFGIGWIGDEVICHKALKKDERFLGLGEKTGALDRRGNAYENWNTDFFAYPVNADPLYMSTPFYIGVNGDKYYGIFFDNTHKSRFNFGASNHRFASFSADAGAMNYYFIYGDSLAEIIQNYTWLTGKMELPPLWSLGFQQCRYSYYPDKEVLQIAQSFRDRKIPCDVIYLDIHYMQDYKVFTWNEQRFSTPQKMVQHLLNEGFKVILIIDPGVKIEENYWVYETGKKENVFVQYPDGTEYAADVWPGTCAFPDYTKPQTRAWWGKLYKQHIEEGIAGFWNDMNEPASWGQSTPNLIGFDFDGNKTTHREARNVYGMQMARSTFEGVKNLNPHKRPFVLTRSGYAGIQRYAAAWTGDNTATDAHMLLGVRLVNSLGLTGIANAGYDIGGFCGEASPTLFARWMSIAAFSPFFRAHTMVNTRSAEPWSFGEQVEEIARNYINLRYRLLPFFYTQFYLSSQNGLPVQASLALNYTSNKLTYLFDNQFIINDNLLVIPTESTHQICKAFLPDAQAMWYFFYNDTIFVGEQVVYVDCPTERLPVYVKAGAFITAQTVIQNTTQAPNECLELHFYFSPQNAEGFYYEDAGEGYEYLQGAFIKKLFLWNATTQTITISENLEGGKFVSKFKKIRLFLHGFQNNIKQKNTPNIKTLTYRWIEPISNFDPFFMPETNTNEIENLPYLDLDFKEESIAISI